MNYPDYVDNIISTLHSAGEAAYIVGGSVRDMLLGVSPHDYDIATSATPERTAKIFSHMRVIETGIKHGTVTVICGSHPVEITTFRIDGSYSDSRHPDFVSFTRDIHADLSRRDFTVNAMAYSKRDGLVDIFGGCEDIERRTIRAVGDSALRFSEDALRIMRAFRFSAQLGFDIDTATLRACGDMAGGLSYVARERIGAEFIKLLLSPNPTQALKKMSECGVLSHVFGDYIPTDKHMALLGDMPCEDYARLGFILSNADKASASEILRSLRCSAKQQKGALATIAGSRICVQNAYDARRLFASTGIYAPAAARASELLGISPSGAYEMTIREQNTPHSLKDMKISGKDIAELGIKGKQIGAALDALLNLVVEDPTLNERDTLLSLANQIILKGNYTDGTDGTA